MVKRSQKRWGVLSRRWSWILCWVGLPSLLWGMEGYTPGVRSFTKEDYGASSQNWSVDQDPQGAVYIANSAGLLEFDGSSWMVHPSPDGNIIRAVAVDHNGVVYTSGYQELGYWIRDAHGVLKYTSLKSKAAPLFHPNVEFWNIFPDGSRVYFQAFTQLLVYENGVFTSLPFDRFVNSAALIGGRLFIQEMGGGIFELRDSLKVPFVTGDFFKGKTMRFLLPYDEGRYLLGTAADGLYLVSEGQITVWESPLNDSFKKYEINRACWLPGGQLIVGTILDGIYAVSREGGLLWHLNSRNGLQNNTVLGLTADREGNLWAALDRGVDLVAAAQPGGVRTFPLEGVGAVYDAAFFERQWYLGTNQGVFTGEIATFPGDFRLVPGTQGQVWDLEVIGRELVIGHNNGTFVLSGGTLRPLSPVSGGFALTADPRDPRSLLQCTYSNLVRYRLEEGSLRLSQIIYNFNELIRFLEFDHLGNIWAGHMHRGIYQLRFNPAGDSVRVVRYYGEESVFGQDHHLRVFKVENRVVFTTGRQLYTYNDLEDKMILYERLNSQLGEYAEAERIIPAGEHLYWMVAPTKIGLWKISGDQARLLREYTAGVFGNQLIRHYENITPLNDHEAVVCLENGIALLDTQSGELPRFPEEENPQKRSVWLLDRDGNAIPLSPDSESYRIPWSLNSFHLRMAFPWFSTGNVTWEWLLEGFSPRWNSNGESPVLAFVRLPAGRYTLKVRAANSWGQRSRELQIPLLVRQPWFWSLPARLFYLLLTIAALLLFRFRVIHNTRKMEQRKREDNERELISLKNEKLQAEISFKSRELANSTMAIIKKNEFLLDIRELVLSQKNQLGNRYPDKYSGELLRRIDNHLSSNDEWKIFETHFEQAHETFMKNLKSSYPDLTPGDMRLCAFLKMNLSSKEIAPLMGISVRGVENHRYRLRRKLNLGHDENLIDVLLQL